MLHIYHCLAVSRGSGRRVFVIWRRISTYCQLISLLNFKLVITQSPMLVFSCQLWTNYNKCLTTKNENVYTIVYKICFHIRSKDCKLRFSLGVYCNTDMWWLHIWEILIYFQLQTRKRRSNETRKVFKDLDIPNIFWNVR